MGKPGEPNGIAAAFDGADLVRSDARFQPFLKDDFNPAEFASQALAEAHTTAPAQVLYRARSTSPH